MIPKKNIFHIYKIILILTTFLFSYTLSVHLKTYPIDGTFQTASILFRISNNEILGQDFFSYLNVGMSYLLFPLFYIFGKTYLATLISTKLVIYLVLNLFLYCVFSLNLESQRKVGSTSFFFTFIIFSLIEFIEIFGIGKGLVKNYTNLDLQFFINFISPGASLRTIRMSPILLFSIFFLNWDKFKFTKKYSMYIVAFFNAFLIVTWPLDYGPITVVFASIVTYYIIFQKDATLFLKLVLFTLFNSTLLFLILTKGSALDFIKYQYIDINNYQSWYFAPFDSGGLLTTLTNENVFLSIIFAFILLNIYMRTKNFKIFVFIAVSLFFGGLLPTIFGHPGNYFYFFKLFIYVNIFLVCLKFIEYELYIHQFSKFISIPIFVLVVIYSVTYILYLDSESLNSNKRYEVSLDMSSFINFYKQNSIYNDTSPGSFIFDPSLGGYINDSYEELFSIESKFVYEEYFGIYGIKFNITPELKVDSIIHTYGDERVKLRKNLEEKPYVVITNNNHSFFEWGLSFNWWFYEVLLSQYKPIKFIDTSTKISNRLSSKLTPSGTVIWEKNSPSKDFNQEWLKCNIDNDFLKLPKVMPGLYSIKVEKSLGKVVTVNNKFKIPYPPASYTLDTNLDPNISEVSFPVVVHEENHYEILVKKNIDSVSRCEYTQILSEVSPIYEQLNFKNIGKTSN